MSDPPLSQHVQGADAAGQPQPDAQPELLHGADRFRPDATDGAPALQDAPESARPHRHQEGWLALPQALLSVIVIALFVVTFVMQAFQIPSGSMENTLLVGDYIMVDKVHYGQGGIWQHVLPYSTVSRGDIIVFRYPINPSQHFVKRVIGLPGDRVRMENKMVWVNGHRLRENYAIYETESHGRFPPGFIYDRMDGNLTLKLHGGVQGEELIVPENSYFVLGDNRDNSSDSRSWGFVPRENVVGRPWLIYFSVDGNPVGIEKAEAANGKLASLMFTVRHFWNYVRWNRTMRLVQ